MIYKIKDTVREKNVKFLLFDFFISAYREINSLSDGVFCIM